MASGPSCRMDYTVLRWGMKIGMQLVMVVAFLSLFFFLYVVPTEREIFVTQINFIVDRLMADLRPSTPEDAALQQQGLRQQIVAYLQQTGQSVPDPSLRLSDLWQRLSVAEQYVVAQKLKEKGLDLGKGEAWISDQRQSLPLQSLQRLQSYLDHLSLPSAAYPDIEQQNRDVIETTRNFVITFFLVLAGVLGLSLFLRWCVNLPLYLGENLLALGTIALVEYLFLNLVTKHYLAARPHLVKVYMAQTLAAYAREKTQQ